jgi:hypothetical protein
VVLVNSDLADTLGVVVLPSIFFGPNILGALLVLLRLLPKPCSTAVGDPGVAPSARRSAALGEAAQTDPGGPIALGLALHRLGELAIQPLPRPTCYGAGVAPESVPFVLDLENSTWYAGTTGRAEGGPRFDPSDEP